MSVAAKSSRKRQSAADKLRKRIENGICRLADEIVHYGAPRHYESLVYDYIADGQALRDVPSMDEIENAIDATGIPRASDED